jgi:UDP-N-acetylglucosamine 1-carboxyvinyltransferase
LLIAGAITQGDLIVANCNPSHLGAVITKLQEAGARVDILGTDAIRVRADGPLRAADISTEEYPGFPTDMQAQYMALATQVEGVSQVKENIFENRFMHVQELVRMGANIKVDGSTAIIRGATRLSSAAVMCSDLRASASLVLAALVADGESILDRATTWIAATNGSKRSFAEWARRFGAWGISFLPEKTNATGA